MDMIADSGGMFRFSTRTKEHEIMTRMFFIGDGSEVLGCEAYEANAVARCNELQAKTDDKLNVYECDPTQTMQDSAGKTVFAHPAEYAQYKEEYDVS